MAFKLFSLQSQLTFLALFQDPQPYSAPLFFCEPHRIPSCLGVSPLRLVPLETPSTTSPSGEHLLSPKVLAQILLSWEASFNCHQAEVLIHFSAPIPPPTWLCCIWWLSWTDPCLLTSCLPFNLRTSKSNSDIQELLNKPSMNDCTKEFTDL